jgi:putative transposase
MEVMEDHIHLVIGVPPRYALSKIDQIMKSISAKKIFKEFPEVTEQFWGGELWNDGYFVRSTGDKVTTEVIRKYIKNQDQKQLSFDF